MRQQATIAIFAAALASSGASAEERRQLDAHAHGSASMDAAIEGDRLLIGFEAPGADIVGFEHAVENDEDAAAVEEAVASLSDALTVFGPSAAAGCVLLSAEVEFTALEGHHDHGHDDHGHDDHAEAKHGHDDHGHDDHAEDKHGHDDHAHDDHADEDGERHAVFIGEYALQCSDIEALTGFDLTYFQQFPNAEEVRLQAIGPAGSTGATATPGAPRLDLSGAI